MLEEWTDFFKPGILFKWRRPDNDPTWRGVFLFLEFEKPLPNKNDSYLIGRCLSPTGEIKRFSQYARHDPKANWERVEK